MKDPTKMLCLSLESHNPALSIDMQLNVVPLLCPELWCFKVEFQKKLWWFFNSFCQTLKLAAFKKLPYLRTCLTYRKLIPTVGTGRSSRFQKGVTRFWSLNTVLLEVLTFKGCAIFLRTPVTVWNFKVNENSI